METNTNSNKKIKNIILNILYSLIVLILLLLIGAKINFSKVVVDGQSMYPTLTGEPEKGYEYGYTDRFLFKLSGLDRYDIVVIEVEKDELWIKRIIGMPNETIQIKQGLVYINDQVLESDTYCEEPIFNPGLAKDSIKLGDNEYFVMGDNRNNSRDSRSSDLGVVKYEQIYGRGFISRGYYKDKTYDEVNSKHGFEVKGW